MLDYSRSICTRCMKKLEGVDRVEGFGTVSAEESLPCLFCGGMTAVRWPSERIDQHEGQVIQTYYSSLNDTSEVAGFGHLISFGDGHDGYCYNHDSYDCFEQLSEEQEREFLRA